MPHAEEMRAHALVFVGIHAIVLTNTLQHHLRWEQVVLCIKHTNVSQMHTHTLLLCLHAMHACMGFVQLEHVQSKFDLISDD